MSTNREKYNISDENLHNYVVNTHRFFESYQNLYCKLFVIEKFVKVFDEIDINDIDSVDIFTSCMWDLIEDMYISANELYKMSNGLSFTNFEGV